MTVVVATKDRAAELERSLRRHDGHPVVVVDNGSSDGTVAVASAAGATVIALGRNAGGAARTVGVQLARTPLVAFADDDSWWAPGALERAAEVLAGHPHLALVAARVLVGEGEVVDPVCDEMRRSPLRPTPAGPGVLGFVACGAVVRRSAYLQVGGFCERYGIGGEEELLALDLAAAGWGLAYVDDVVAHHHPSPSRDPGRRQVVQRRNALWTAWLRRPLLVGLGRAGGSLGSRQGRRALVEAVCGLRWVMACRSRVPAEVELMARHL